MTRRSALPSLRRRRLERGGAAALVAVIFGGGVFLGVSALTLDVGSIWWERRQLQNSADAAALAVASKCADSTTAAACLLPNSTIAAYANANTADKATSIDGVCGRFIAGLSTCPSASDNAAAESAATQNLAKCLPLPASFKTGGANANTPYVEVRVGTGSGATQSQLSGIFSRAVTGQDNPHVSACARAAWGGARPTSATVLNITISECDWRAQTGYTGVAGSAVYPAGPVGAKPGYTALTWPLFEQTVYTKGNTTSCDTSSPGGTAPGGFAALSASAGCSSVLSLGSDGYFWAEGDPGNDVPCDGSQLTAYQGTVVYLPIFDCMTDAVVTVTASTNCSSGNGSHNQYRISGFAAFYLAGWHMSNTSADSIRPPYKKACPAGGDRCLVGWFIADTVAAPPSSGSGGGGSPNYGIQTVFPAG